MVTQRKRKSYTKRPMRMRKRSKYAKKKYAAKKRFTRAVRSVVLRTSERKYLADNEGKTELYHNVPSQGTLFGRTGSGMPTVGTGSNQRIGDSIYISAIKFRIMMYAKADRPNTGFKFLVLQSKNGLSGNPIRAVTGNNSIDPVATTEWRVLASRTIQDKPGLANTTLAPGGVEHTRYTDIYIPIKRTVHTLGQGGTNWNMEDIVLWVCAYDTYGTLTTDNIGAFQFWTELYFRDV